MGKPSCKKVHKHEKKQQITSKMSSIKIVRPRVYITDSSKFKNLVQHLTGNSNEDSPRVISLSSPPPSIPVSPPAPYLECLDYGYQENSLDDLSFDSSCFSTPIDGSPYSHVEESLNYYEMGNSLPAPSLDFASQYKELEALLMGLNPVTTYDSSVCGVVNQQEVCSVYDYDFPCFV